MTRIPTRSAQVDELTAALRHFDLARARVANALAPLAGTPPRDSSPAARPVSLPVRPASPSPSPERSPPLLPNSDYRLGDRVRIRFPSPGQQSTGVIIGVSRGGFLYVRTSNDDVVRRLPHNLTPF